MTPPPPATTVLTCHDILATIFDNLDPGRFNPDDSKEEKELFRRHSRHALATSALSCSAISYQALNVLWRELDNVQPLLKVLLNYKRVDSGFKLCGPILPDHWTRFQLYADRVRVILDSPRQSEDPIHPSIWPFLAAMCKGSPLMPRLRKLTADNVVVPENSAFILLQLSPTLRVVDLSIELEFNNEYEIVPLLHTLPLMAPDLEKLTFDIDDHGEVSLEHGYLESFGLHFTRLKTLSIGRAIPLEATVLQLLSSISTLKDLTCTIDSSSSLDLAVEHNRCTFKQLASLDVRGHLNYLVTFFHTCQLPSLARTRLRILGPQPTRGPEDSFAAIYQSCNPASLTSFFVDITFSSDLRPNSLMQYSEPLLAFPNITSFRFRCFSGVPPVCDNELVRFGTAWPRLESFRVENLIACFPLPDTVARPTLSGIIALTQRCPRLNRFHISELDVTVIPPKNEIPFAGHGVRHFRIDKVMPELPSRTYMEVAVVLDRVFPDIDLQYASSNLDNSPDGLKWKEILQFLEAMRLGREHCELRAKLRQAAR